MAASTGLSHVCQPATDTMPMVENVSGDVFETSKRRRRKPMQFEDVYLAEAVKSEAAVHAEALLDLMREFCTPGKYIEVGQLERMYGEHCKAMGWQPRHWTAIARQLGKMTEKRKGKRNGRKVVAYRVPKP